MADFIHHYAIVKMSSDPMYGRDQTIRELSDRNLAISLAKQIPGDNICVEHLRYASQENLQKGFTFDRSVCWAKWMKGKNR